MSKELEYIVEEETSKFTYKHWRNTYINSKGEIKKVDLKPLSHAIAERVKKLVLNEEKLMLILVKELPDLLMTKIGAMAKSISQQAKFKEV